MAIRTIIDERGIVQVFVPDGTPSALNVNVPATIPSRTYPVTTGSTGMTVAPGFYMFSGSTNTTASLPSAVLYPGAGITVYCSGSGALATMLITGSSPSNSFPTIVPAGGGGVHGSRMVMNAGSSVRLWSDSRYWCLIPLSGTVTIS